MNIAYLAVLTKFHFWNYKNWNLVKKKFFFMKLIYIWFHEFFGLLNGWRFKTSSTHSTHCGELGSFFLIRFSRNVLHGSFSSKVTMLPHLEMLTLLDFLPCQSSQFCVWFVRVVNKKREEGEQARKMWFLQARYF